MGDNRYSQPTQFATMLILDVGPYMWAVEPEDAAIGTPLERAKTACQHIFHSKIVGAKAKDLIGLILVGAYSDGNTIEMKYGCKNIELKYDLAAATLEHLKFVTDECPQGLKEGDLMDGVIVALTVIQKFVGNKKYAKSIYVLSTAEAPMDQSDQEYIISKCVDYEVKINVIGFGFSEDGPSEPVTTRRAHNERFLRTLAKETGGEVFHGDEALQLLSSLRARSVRPVTVCRGSLTLSDPDDPETSLDVKVWAYGKIMEAKIPTAKKWSRVAKEAADIVDEEKVGLVDMDRIYKRVNQVIEDDEDGGMRVAEQEAVTKEDLVKAYRYGKDLVPFSEEDMEAMSLSRGRKGFQILGFVNANEIPRESLLNNALQIIPDPTEHKARTIFEVLAVTLKTTAKVALVRYLRSETAGRPKLGVLIPHVGRHIWCAWIQIPFKEDIREYSFASLVPLLEDIKKPEAIGGTTKGLLPSQRNGSQLQSQSQHTAPQSQSEAPSQSQIPSSQSLVSSVIKVPVDNVIAPQRKKALVSTRKISSEEADRRIDDLINSMDLMTAIEEGGEMVEAYKCSEIFNPYYQRMFQCIAHRALNPDDQKLPEVDPRFIAGLLPMQSVVERAKPYLEAVKEGFAVKKIEYKKETIRDKVARQLAAQQLKDLETGGDGAAEGENAYGMMDLDDPTIDRINFVSKVGTVDPVTDFNKMIARRDQDLVPAAIEQMSKHVLEIVQQSFGASLFPKAIACLTALRAGCITHSEVDTFNDWMKGFKTTLLQAHRNFWDHLVSNCADGRSLGLITSSDSPESSVSKDEAAAFLKVESVPTSSAAVPEVVDDDDDLLAMLD